MPDKSEKRAREIIDFHISRIDAQKFPHLLSVILVGSLSNGSYTGKPGSDIDLLHILDDGAPESAKRDILTVFWSCWRCAQTGAIIRKAPVRNLKRA